VKALAWFAWSAGLLAVFQPRCGEAGIFAGRITADQTRAGQLANLIYTAGTNWLRVEETNPDRPHAWNLLNRQSGDMVLVFPHNQSFVRLSAALAAPAPPMAPAGLPPSVPGPPPPGFGPPPGSPPQFSAQGAPAMPAMPMPPIGLPATVQLTATGKTTNLLGYACAGYQLQFRNETMTIWATDQLLPFQPYLEYQPHHIGGPVIEELWGELLKTRKLFPLLAVLKFDNGSDHLRFEVKSVVPQGTRGDTDPLFKPPPDYREVRPLPF
jgi:hypothetical protein